MKKIRCMMCGSEKSTLQHSFKSDFNQNLEKLRIVKCDNCGLVFMNPQPSVKELLTFYPDSLHQGKRKSKLRFLKELYEQFRIKDVMRQAKRLNIKPKNILDVGCSNGFFLKLAEKEGMEIYGTEFGDKQIKYLKKNITKNIYHSEKELVGKMKFDIITAFDVIEHLPDPDAFISNCSKLLKPNGLLVVMTMALDSWTYRKYKEKVVWLCDQHLYYFTRENMKSFLAKHGLRVYRTKIYNNTPLHFVSFILQMLKINKAEFADTVNFYAVPAKSMKKTE